MKKLLLFGLMAVFASAQADAAPVRRDPEEFPNHFCGGPNARDPFKIAGFAHYPPFSWKAADLDRFKETRHHIYTYDGFVAEYVKEALKKIKVKDIESLFFDSEEEMRRAVLEGKVDLVFTTFYRGGDRTGLDYIYPAYFGNPLAVISRADKKVEKSEISDLKGMIGVIRREEGMLPLIQGQLPTDTKIIEVDGVEAAFKKLTDGEADFMISSPYAVMAEAKRLNMKDKIYIHPKALRPVKFFAAFSKMSRCMRYKKLLEPELQKLFEDKSSAEKKMKEYIDKWAKNGDTALDFPEYSY